MGWGGMEPNINQMGANNYLAQMRDFHLSPFGRDRARCRVFENEGFRLFLRFRGRADLLLIATGCNHGAP